VTVAGDILQDVQDRYKLKQKDIGDILGYERSMISNVKSGRRNISEEVLGLIPDRLQDDRTAMLICKNCNKNGFFSGQELPDELDAHPAELLSVFQLEFKELLVVYGKYLDALRAGSIEQEDKVAEVLAKQAFDFIPLLWNLSLALNKRHKTYHKTALKKVNCSVKSLINRRKEKAAFKAAK